MPLEDDYPYIRGWGKMNGSMQHYIDRQIEQARVDNAPQNAVYKRSEYSSSKPNEWITLDDVSNPEAFIRMGLPIPDRLKFFLRIQLFKYTDDESQRDYLANRIYEFFDSLGLERNEDFFISTENHDNQHMK